VLQDRAVERTLTLTGQDRRVFLVFNVYDIAHYAEPGAPLEEPGALLRDGAAKAIAIRFSRNIGRDRVRRELRKTLQINAQPAWLEEAQETIDAFVAAIDRDAREGDQLVYSWLEGGRLRAEFNGEPFFEVEDEVFAKLIWSIWFGEEPVCDTDKLLARVPGKGA